MTDGLPEIEIANGKAVDAGGVVWDAERYPPRRRVAGHTIPSGHGGQAADDYPCVGFLDLLNGRRDSAPSHEVFSTEAEALDFLIERAKTERELAVRTFRAAERDLRRLQQRRARLPKAAA